MKRQITIYDRATGTQLQYRRISFGREPILIADDQDWFDGFVPDTAYIDIETGQPVEKPEMPIVVAGNQITGIPIGATLAQNLSRLPDPIDDGEHTFEVDYPQVVHVSIQHPKYLLWEGEVHCEPE